MLKKALPKEKDTSSYSSKKDEEPKNRLDETIFSLRASATTM